MLYNFGENEDGTIVCVFVIIVCLIEMPCSPTFVCLVLVQEPWPQYRTCVWCVIPNLHGNTLSVAVCVHIHKPNLYSNKYSAL